MKSYHKKGIGNHTDYAPHIFKIMPALLLSKNLEYGDVNKGRKGKQIIFCDNYPKVAYTATKREYDMMHMSMV